MTSCGNGSSGVKTRPLQFKRGTANALYKANIILLEGQPCIETDTLLMKVGNGSTRYNSLPYVGEAFKGINGKSAYEIWKDQGFEGTEMDFLESLIGETGKSAYESWIDLGNEGSVADFIASLEGAKGYSAYEVWLQEGNQGSVTDYLNSLVGKSAYEIWLELGNEGTKEDFINSLKGPQGYSAYEIWLKNGNTGTEKDFLDSLKGESSFEAWKKAEGKLDATEEEFIASLLTTSWGTF